jgi:spermidine synthase
MVALAERLYVLTAITAAGLAAAVVAAVQLAPDTGGTISAVQAQNWSPLYRTSGYVKGQEPPSNAGLKLLYAKDTRYHRLSVAEDTETRYLRFDNTYQSGMFRGRPFATAFEYADLFHLLKAYDPNARKVLFIGLGGGSSPKRIWRDFPDMQVQAVELDPVVVDVAYKYFALPRDPRLQVAVDDGRRYLDRHEDKWDAILIDAFFADAIPFHLFTNEFMELVRSRLNPGGVVMTNTIGSIAGGRSRLFRSVYRTYRSVFPTVLVHPTIIGADGGDTDVRNLILVATEGAAPSKAFLAERWREIQARYPKVPDLLERIRQRHDRPISITGVPTLTDQYAPTDALLLIQ